jgi:Flp pilus assembly pilin Flp
MRNAIDKFWVDDRGQDLVEYTLLLGVMALGAASFFRPAGTSVQTIWGVANTTIRNAATAAS